MIPQYGSYWWNQKHHILPFDWTNIYFLSPTSAQRVLSFKTDKKYRTTDKQAISLDVGNFHNKSDRLVFGYVSGNVNMHCKIFRCEWLLIDVEATKFATWTDKSNRQMRHGVFTHMAAVDPHPQFTWCQWTWQKRAPKFNYSKFKQK